MTASGGREPAAGVSGRGKYRTIVCDPPWRYRSSLPIRGARRSATPYETLTVEGIAALPVRDMAAGDAHLYLWTTNTHMEHAWKIARGWGFEPSTVLVWCKPPKGHQPFFTFNIATEFVLFCRRGSLPALTTIERNWWEWSRGPHSAKPEAFIDMVEQVSPPPYVELFARRHRLGWDVHGFESANTAQWGDAS